MASMVTTDAVGISSTVVARSVITVAPSMITLPISTAVTGARFAAPSVRAPVQCTDRSTGPGSGRCAARIYLSVQSEPGGTPCTTFQSAGDRFEKCTGRSGDRHPDQFALPFRSLSRRDGSHPAALAGGDFPFGYSPGFSVPDRPAAVSLSHRTHLWCPQQQARECPAFPCLYPTGDDPLLPERHATDWRHPVCRLHTGHPVEFMGFPESRILPDVRMGRCMPSAQCGALRTYYALVIIGCTYRGPSCSSRTGPGCLHDPCRSGQTGRGISAVRAITDWNPSAHSAPG